ncbi:BREX-3 system phosphatase PglZ [Telmatobacter bradus]|uniref:BREX-3 system phosphatase PglZ n=1 Tax=Telmatobacter bradus TaxID=474953 RepID=UPI003B431C24
MSSWRAQILKEFTPNSARLTLVADPDGLLLEEGILQGIRERGFELVPFEDSVTFRYAYESKFRSRWDRGEQTDLVVVLRSQSTDISGLPFDLLLAGRKLSFSLGDLFPGLSYPVVAALDRGDLDTLYLAQEQRAPGLLGDNATKEFVLRHVFEVAPELIKQPSDLLRVLLRRHYRDQRIPDVLNERFIQLLRQNSIFDGWPLEVLVADREAFFAFLQERWPIFLDRQIEKGESGESKAKGAYSLAIKGPADIPFEHQDIRVYIDNLFVEGMLHPISHELTDSLSRSWASIGILTAPVDDKYRRLGKLIAGLQISIPADDAKHTDWFHFARTWAELVVLMAEEPNIAPGETNEAAKSLQASMDAGFTAWLLKRYAGLVNLPPVPPVMLHHLPRFLARQTDQDHRTKLALIVMDGLAMDQWLIVRDSLAQQQPEFGFREEAVFAWIPSLTSVSRQATFAGKAPIFFPNSIWTTDREPVLWTQFWADQGFTENEIVYLKGLGDGCLENVSDAVSHPRVRIAGLVIDKIDKIMHGMELGTAGMHNQVGQWARGPYLKTLLNLLLDNGFRVYLTSDHGNIEAEGCGRPTEGAVADLRGERARVYPDAALRDKVKISFPTALEWNQVGLPENYFPLLAPARRAFIQEHKQTVCHGGISVEELIVPLIKIERRCE